MSALELARWQFAGTASLHFLFVALTLGLVVTVAVMQTRYVMRGHDTYRRMTRFWGKLYAINYAVGIATGLVMEFQIGLNWSGLSRLTGDVFGAPLALETLIAFVLESTLLGMWLFGWDRLGKRLHLALIWGVAATALLSAFWVMVANAFLQHPVGYAMDSDGHARLDDFGALLTNSSLWFALMHAVFAAVTVGGMFVAGVSAWHLRRDPGSELFRRSLRMGLPTAMVGLFLTVGFGFAQFGPISTNQPTKLGGGDASRAAQAEMVAAFGPGDYLPNGALVGIALGLMIMISNLLFLVLFAAWLLTLKDVIVRKRWARPMLRVLVWIIPVPFVVSIFGWLVREEGRQPWAVYGLLKTEDAVSPIGAGALQLSTAGFGLLLAALVVTDWWLLASNARRGVPAEVRTKEAVTV